VQAKSSQASNPKWVEYKTNFKASLIITWDANLERVFLVEKQDPNFNLIQAIVSILASSVIQRISTEQGSATTTPNQSTGEVSSGDDVSDFEEDQQAARTDRCNAFL